ncbi:tyrosine-protein kinase domain-containing protein [Tuwongella immobilis]|uniref:CobQ/CobB/MinD/ParA nucleotide binding domain-containing protein n=1 Tax=Tuwongella immobilis TaxID=692036 RepID=A0A6C2YVS9_9BACT|nr:hypothetical protein [Tuwongella immobilis]VIP05730.1 lipopolysaccharide biosynthesis protein : Capsular exopolysaccharide biosynthesis protein OS=Singulisphaera acidiphila (strain ATCC BAA-1392 / DSM 18658 / VKM B-2454 / MOB10) GN=Sinac_5456 PE=4 SV=1: Wzz: AAA_31 [Tuwongella immobilis]VTS08816.1 lipopolysaccharide biosynthesis protein : Capsular exopolysaccharide biosynthesis protein OS=Singulisphaera acidiphila (strain ATCC BAA-1392 / DSM 18658 / VKM B-2454 / MOB10) GN=Sinac_5456 PE=4 SV=1:
MTPSIRQPLRLRRLPATVSPGGETDAMEYRELPQPQPIPSDGLAEAASPNRLLGYLLLHWPMVLILGSMLGAGMAYLAYTLIPAKYTTYAMIRVALVPPSVSGFQNEEAARNDFLTCLKTQTQLIKSHFVLNAAIRDPAIAELPMIRSQVDPVAFLQDEVRVEYTDNSEIIKIILSGDNASEITKIVNSIQDAYFREVVDEEGNRKKNRLVELENLKHQTQESLNKSYEAIRNDLTVQNQLPGGAKPTLSKVILDDPIAKAMAEAADVNRMNQLLMGQASGLRNAMLKQDAEISATKRRIERLKVALTQPAPIDPAAELKLRDQLDKEPVIITQQQKALSTKKRYDALKANALNPNAPELQNLAKAVEREEAELKRLVELATKEFNDLRSEAHHLQVRSELQAAEIQLAEFQEQRKDTESTLTTVESKVLPTPVLPTQSKEGMALSKLENKEVAILDFDKVAVAHQEEILHKIVDKVNLLKLEEKAPPRVRRLAAAPVPSKKEYKKQLVATAGGGFMGFVLVALGAILFELRLRRMLSLQDLQQIARGPVLGVIPQSEFDRATEMMPVHVLEAVDKCRTQIVQHTLALDHKSIMITSALADEGKANFTWQLTQSFVQSGYRTLLIDLDVRSPMMHEFYGVLNEGGVCEVLRGESELSNSIQTFADGLSFLPGGKWTDSIRQDLVTDKIGMLLAKVREYYDVILVHAHPLLEVADSYLIGRQVDSVILTVQKLVTRQPLLDRVQERANELGKEPFGLVFLDATPNESLC